MPPLSFEEDKKNPPLVLPGKRGRASAPAASPSPWLRWVVWGQVGLAMWTEVGTYVNIGLYHFPWPWVDRAIPYVGLVSLVVTATSIVYMIMCEAPTKDRWHSIVASTLIGLATWAIFLQGMVHY